METSLRILLIDDDEDDQLIVSDLLREVEQTRYTLELVLDADKGVQAAVRGGHDIILLDYRLGARSGLEVMRELTARGVRTPVIMLTGQGDPDIDRQASRAGAYDYLVKGNLSAEGLERAIRYAMAHARSVDALRATVRMSSALLTGVHAMDEALVVADPSQHDLPLVFVSEGFVRLTGYPREEVLGRNCRFMQGEGTDPAKISAMREATERGEPFDDVLLNYRHDGSPFYNHLRLLPVRDHDDKLVYYVALSAEAGSPDA